MWTRAELKSRAKVVLKTSYWKAFLVSLIIAFVGGNGGSGGSSYSFGSGDFSDFVTRNDSRFLPVFMVTFFSIFLIILVAILCFRVFLGYPLEVGGRTYFLRSAENNVDMNYLGYSFNGQRYMSIVKTMFFRGLFIFLWTLLLIIPGIIKSYAFSMVPYILADNPNIGYKRALQLSSQMTKGEKFDIFVLDLSFIGWYILGVLALGIGVFFVMPYENATKAELYLILRQKSLQNESCSYEELNIITTQ